MAHVDFFKSWAFGCRVFAHDDVNVIKDLHMCYSFSFKKMSMRRTRFKARATFSIDVVIFQGLGYKGSQVDLCLRCRVACLDQE